MAPVQLPFPVGLERRLRTRKKRADRIRDELQQKSRSLDSVAQLIESLKRGDRIGEDAFASLRVGLAARKRRERRHHFDAVLRQKLRQVRVVREAGDRQVAPVHHMTPGGTGAADDVAEEWVQLGRAAGDIERGNVARFEKPQARVDDFRRHDLGAIRAGIHVAMVAGLVAPLADVHLKHRDAGRAQGMVARRGGRRLEGPGERQRRQRRALCRGLGQRMSRVE